MTETIDTPAADGAKKRGGGLSTMLLADLKAMAGGLGVAGAGTMKKAQLVDAIRSAQSGGRPVASSAPDEGAAPAGPAVDTAPKVTKRARKPRQAAAEDAPQGERAAETTTQTTAVTSAETPVERPAARAPREDAAPARADRAPDTTPDAAPASQAPSAADSGAEGQADREPQRNRRTRGAAQAGQAETEPTHDDDVSQQSGRQRRNRQGGDEARDQQRDGQQRDQQRDGQQRDQQARDQQRDQQDGDGDGDGEGRRNRRRRGRDRTNRVDGPGQGTQSGQGGQGSQSGQGNQGSQGGTQPSQHAQRGSREPDTTILENDVLVPAAGILDVLDNYAFVRTSGYLPGTDDVYVSLSMVRKFGLRRGDAVMGQVRQPREGERKEKFNPMVRIDSVNGSDPEAAKNRPEFARLTPVHPTERLRLETEPTNLIGRVIDLAAPIGKGQRGLIVAPEKAGRTTILQSIAQAVTVNNPECHLMVVLVDERPEEVTDFERSVKGEVIASTFDRPPGDHTVVAELAIERAKRLVELGHDVVVLLDGLTRLARAYNLSATSSGRILTGGVDSAAVHPPKRFFGAARNIEDGGSLTILATALVETGSAVDEVIFEELSGTANMELRLSRALAEKRLFPAVDLVRSSTRREELLMGAEEVAILGRLRHQLGDLDEPRAHEMLLDRLRTSQTNIELLMQLQKAPARTR